MRLWGLIVFGGMTLGAPAMALDFGFGGDNETLGVGRLFNNSVRSSFFFLEEPYDFMQLRYNKGQGRQTTHNYQGTDKCH